MRIASGMVAVVLAFGVAAAPAAAQGLFGTRPPAEPLTREQVRTRVLDACVYDMSKRPQASETPVVQKCQCYSRDVAKMMSEEEISGYARRPAIPARIRGAAEASFSRCR